MKRYMKKLVGLYASLCYLLLMVACSSQFSPTPVTSVSIHDPDWLSQVALARSTVQAFDSKALLSTVWVHQRQDIQGMPIDFTFISPNETKTEVRIIDSTVVRVISATTEPITLLDSLNTEMNLTVDPSRFSNARQRQAELARIGIGPATALEIAQSATNCTDAEPLVMLDNPGKPDPHWIVLFPACQEGYFVNGVTGMIDDRFGH